MPSVPPLLSRLLALSLLVALIAIGWTGAVQPVIASLHNMRVQIGQMRELLSKYQDINMSRNDIQEELSYLRHEINDIIPKRDTISEINSPISSSWLQSAVSDIIKQHGGYLLSIEIIPERDEVMLRTISVRVQFSAHIKSLVDIFHDLESARPYLFLDNLQIHTSHGTRGTQVAQVQESSAGIGTLFISCDVYSYIQK